MYRFIKSALLVFGISYVFSGSGVAAEKLSVFVSIVPQKYFVQQIGKDLVDVQVMVKPGASPATYEPKPRQMADLSATSVYLSIGVSFEDVWLEKIAAANPKMRIIHTDADIEKRAMVVHHHEVGQEDEHPHETGHDHHKGEHSGHHEHHHQHAGLDPHIWLSPPLVKIQARTILTALQAADPANKSTYATNFRTFVAKIDALDTDLKQIFADKTGLQFMVFHPAWGYFAQSYGLRQVPVEIEGKSPKPAQLKALITHARENGIKVIFVQPQFSTRSAGLIAREIGGQVAFADPLAADWMANLRQVADRFQAALK